jgi:cytoskeletal protein RodZ
MIIGFVLHAWRLYWGLTLQQAAKKIGLPLSTLGRIEQGGRVNDRNKAILLQFLFEYWGDSRA